MQAASAAANPAPMFETIYAPGATYLPGHEEMGIDRRDTFLKMMVGSQRRLRQNGGQVSMKFRVVERKRFGDIYVDNGYMRTAMTLAKDGPEQVTYGKFITVLGKQPDGSYAFVTDGDSSTPAANFDNAEPVPGLKFDR